MLTGNKGEWAELYAFLKILSDQKLPVADDSISIIPNQFITFLTLNWLDAQNGLLVYKFNGTDIDIFDEAQSRIKTIPSSHISGKLQSIFSKIVTARGRAFPLPLAETLMGTLHRTTLKAASAKKADIFATLVNQNTKAPELSGFSVKSMLKGKATLLNASGQTLFRYEITGLSQTDVSAINAISSRGKYMDKALEILQRGGQFNFQRLLSRQFERNLRMIDTLLPEFVAEMLVGFFTKQGKTVIELTKFLSTSTTLQNQYGFKFTAEDYAFKLKQLLSASALGMQPSKSWDGLMHANGGYLIVVKSGDVLCYDAFNRDVFLSYLLNNTMFDSPAGRDRPYLELFYENGKLYTDLKLQIRFSS